MDSQYLKQTVGNAVTEALTDLILHGHAQNHPNLSIDPEANQLSTSQDPVTYVARFLMNYDKSAEKIKKDNLDSKKIQAAVTKILDEEKNKKLQEKLALEQAAAEAAAAELRAQQAVQSAALAAQEAAQASAPEPVPQAAAPEAAPVASEDQPATQPDAAPREEAAAPIDANEAPAEQTEETPQ
jgi:hypothetical protein